MTVRPKFFTPVTFTNLWPIQHAPGSVYQQVSRLAVVLRRTGDADVFDKARSTQLVGSEPIWVRDGCAPESLRYELYLVTLDVLRTSARFSFRVDIDRASTP